VGKVDLKGRPRLWLVDLFLMRMMMGSPIVLPVKELMDFGVGWNELASV